MSEMVGKTLNGRYRITERIGLGGMAEVYRAQDLVLGRTVAVKVMLPQYASDTNFTQRFRQEAAASANLQSPYIVNIYDWGQDDGMYYIVMEYVRGTDLKSAIRERGALNQRKVAEIGMQVCKALSVAHNNDIIHRDIKPQNIMVQPDGNVKVMDFGIARAKNSVMTQTQSVLGTAHYISPEQAQGKPLTATSDIYSLGIVLYEAATGTLPFDGPDAVSVAMKQVNELPADPRAINSEISSDLANIIMRALAKNPLDRFSTANEMGQALNDYLMGRNISNIPTQVIGAAAMGGAATAGVAGNAASSTTVMPASMKARQNAQNGMTGRQSIVTSNEESSNDGGKKKGIIGIIVGVIVVIAAVVIAINLFGGSKTIEVPNVVGMTTDEATETIQDAGFSVGSISQDYSSEVDEGLVMSQDPASDTKKEAKSKVNLVVSKGTEHITVPDIVGLSAADAKAELQKVGLTAVAGTAEYSDEISKDRVVSQSPAAGTDLAKGDSVTYILSLGEEKGEVPNVIGMGYQDAESTLQDAGFKTSTQWAEHDEDAGIVYWQDPSSGNVASGSTVTIYVSNGPAATPTPTATAEPSPTAEPTAEPSPTAEPESDSANE